MESLTILIAVAGSVLVLLLRPCYALCVYCAVMVCYPPFLTVPVGPVDFSVSRIMILPLLFNAIFLRKTVRETKLDWVDGLVAMAFVGKAFGIAQTVPLGQCLTGEGGVAFDTLLPYIATRCIIHTKKDLLTLFKALIITGIPLAIMGAYETITGRNPVGFMVPYYGFGMAERMRTVERFGLTRASVTFGNYINFGLFFAALAPICLGLWKQRVWKMSVILSCCAFLLLGAFSSISSAALFSLYISFAMLACFPFRRYWPLMAGAGLGMIVFVECYSNRHAYEVLTRFALSPTTAYYRIGLFQEALGGGMDGHWLYGYGYVGIGPGNDNTNFHWEHQDITNIYIAKLVRGGLVALIPFLVLNVFYYRRLYEAYRSSRSPADEWLVWCIAAALVGWNVAMMTVAALELVNTLLHMLIAVCCGLPALVRREYRLSVSQRIARAVLPQRGVASIVGNHHA